MSLSPEEAMAAAGGVEERRVLRHLGPFLRPEPEKLIRPSRFVMRDPASLPPREWLYGRHLIRRFVSVKVAPGGVGKSALTAVECLAMATGRTLLHDHPEGPLRVWYWNGEDPQEETERRFAAACLHYGITEQDLGGRLYFDSGRDLRICVAKDGKNGLNIAEPQVAAIINAIKRDKIDVMSVDPFVKSHGVSESDNTKIDAVASQWGMIADVTNCAIELVHHVRKGASGDENEYTVDDSRGAGALINAARSARVLNRMSKDKAPEAKIAANRRWAYFRVDDGKQNLAPPNEKATWCQLIGVSLGNGTQKNPFGDNVGVVTPWSWPDSFDGITVDHTRQVQRAVAKGSFRDSVQARDWVGIVVADVLGLDPSMDRGRIKKLLAAWFASEVLKRELRDVPGKGRNSTYVVAGAPV